QRGVPPPALSPPVPPAFWLSRTGPLPLLDDLDQESLRQALQRSLEYARRLPPDRPLAFGDTQIPASRLLQTLEAFQQALSLSPTPEALQRTLQERFEVVQSPGRDAQGDVLFTGYYEIELEGSPVASVQFPYPVYKRPPDLADTEAARSASGRVYYTRREIDVEGRLRGRGLELYWLRNPVDGFFLHVQGSGQIRLPDGRIQRVSYAASNGHPYTSIGRILLDEGRIPRAAMSLQGLRRYFRERPEEVTRVLYQNARYVFFRPVAHAPQGNLGVTLVPGRSIATDQRVFPAGGVAFVQMQQPVWNAEGTILTWKPATRFVFNHDTGSAITGPGRVDLFWGNGAKAEVAAGHMQHSGQLFFLLKRTP
ncbi:MAG: transglycosylase, partial [Candidatus Tectomicrobia bacterium]|nr:transglycosylase [Candidatus Tectomicrobia bacterium]